MTDPTDTAAVPAPRLHTVAAAGQRYGADSHMGKRVTAWPARAR
ncbi:hypothetical protein [Pseudorhodoferax sp. Leaf267]|nr:hypothetical protein [Pseudorhodoferax sp. Leaf267]